MESTGVVQCFRESEDFHKVGIISFFGDGDTKFHSAVIKANPYPGTIVQNPECVRHVQKRCGSRLRSIKNAKTRLLLMANQFWLPKNLTHKCINELQNCYGIAMRQNCQTGDINIMRKAVGAVFCHCSEANDLESQHQFRPQANEALCKYQADS